MGLDLDLAAMVNANRVPMQGHWNRQNMIDIHWKGARWGLDMALVETWKGGVASSCLLVSVLLRIVAILRPGSS